MAIGPVSVAVGRETRLGQSLIGADAGYGGPLAPGDLAYTFLTDSVHVGRLFVDGIDRSTQTLIGRFSFTAMRWDSATIQVRNGEFRVHYAEP